VRDVSVYAEEVRETVDERKAKDKKEKAGLEVDGGQQKSEKKKRKESQLERLD
jgi:hypothetical protein